MKKLLKAATLTLAIVCATAFLVACGIPAKPAKTRKNLEMEGYTFNTVIELALKTAMTVLQVETNDVIVATKIEEGEVDNVLLVYCKSKETAKKMEDKIIEELRKEYSGEGEIRYGRDGKVIYFGTEDGVEDCN
jgi:hypothetical protein